MKKLVKVFAFLFVICLMVYSVYAISKRRSVEKYQSNPIPDKSSVKDENSSEGNFGSGNNSEDDNNSSGNQKEDSDDGSNLSQVRLSEEEIAKIKPDEAGKVMVVMFHNFIEAYKSGDKEYTTTFDEFRKLLQVLYDKGYRLISLNEYVENNISVPAGCIPMVFTFDDGTSGQFNLVEEDGLLVVNKKSAVGIMEEFNEAHPDFGLKGTFFVNLGLKTFDGKGTVEERLKYLIDKGFEIGNHTLNHIKLSEVGSAEKIQQEIGSNQKKMFELVSDYKMDIFSLPYGLPSKNLVNYVVEGEFEGIKYRNKAIMEVGWDPNPSPVSKKFNPLSVHRVRASGIKPVQADLAWWLSNLKRDGQYISDGNADTVTVPKKKEGEVDSERLKSKELITY